MVRSNSSSAANLAGGSCPGKVPCGRPVLINCVSRTGSRSTICTLSFRDSATICRPKASRSSVCKAYELASAVRRFTVPAISRSISSGGSVPTADAPPRRTAASASRQARVPEQRWRRRARPAQRARNVRCSAISSQVDKFPKLLRNNLISTRSHEANGELFRQYYWFAPLRERSLLASDRVGKCLTIPRRLRDLLRRRPDRRVLQGRQSEGRGILRLRHELFAFAPHLAIIPRRAQERSHRRVRERLHGTRGRLCRRRQCR